MSDNLDMLMQSSGNELYHSADYMHYITTHLKYLKENGASQTEINRGLVNKFQFNFFSLLVELNYSAEDFIPLLLINGFSSPSEMTNEFEVMTIPNPEVLSNLKSLYRYQNKRV